MITNRSIDEACLAKARKELENLGHLGVVSSGNAFSEIVFLKGHLLCGESGVDESDASASGASASSASVLTKRESRALEAALERLGYSPEDFSSLSTYSSENKPLDPAVIRLALATLDPATVVVLDMEAAAHLCEAYASELSFLKSSDGVSLPIGRVIPLLGMRVMLLGDFAGALDDTRKKQRVWSYLKQVPSMGEPY